MLPTNSTKIIINAKGRLKGNSRNLQNLVRLMRGDPITGNKHFDYAQKKIKEINDDPKRRALIMDYEAKLLEREQLGEQQKAIKITKSTIEQLKATGYDGKMTFAFIKKLDTGLSDDALLRLVDKYYK
ncbi:MAG: hypothetical protein LKJ51_00735 [Limosilactobacillus sp.]|jgi:hypothetical protein|uniref:hypothetical protein n=1 Tax=Limosilactobacillus sp. TaxID=2773925 RepID=UPI0025C01B3B|nr:hypothetical protein [Limosilactobacillus sp.]MCI1974434.1 hypothetical protein [Limosilactobacillus sp.]